MTTHSPPQPPANPPVARPGLPPTAPQVDYLRSLQRRLRLPDALLDSHCVATWGHGFAELDRAEASVLIDEMLGWRQIPAQLRREAGQRDLPGFGS